MCERMRCQCDERIVRVFVRRVYRRDDIHVFLSIFNFIGLTIGSGLFLFGGDVETGLLACVFDGTIVGKFYGPRLYFRRPVREAGGV